MCLRQRSSRSGPTTSGVPQSTGKPVLQDNKPKPLRLKIDREHQI